MATDGKREKFSSRLGFLLVAAGCAIGLGNVWRFPHITGQCGGALFVLIYLGFLFAVGLPFLIIEIAVGRAARKSLSGAFEVLAGARTGWRHNKYWMIAGNYILMSFYGLITGWLLYYSVRFTTGGFSEGISEEQAAAAFTGMLADPGMMFVSMLACSAVAFWVIGMGVVKGVERITKPMMILLLVMLVAMSVHSVFLPGFSEGISYYLIPDGGRIEKAGLLKIIWNAMGQAFFTLSIGIGSIEIFGTYANKDCTVVSEAVWIAVLDTVMAVLAGFVIFPACFTFGVEPSAGPGLLFITLNTVFSNISGGMFWGSLFFFFMFFAAMTTLITVYENIVSMTIELFDISRKRSVIINFMVLTALSIPVLLGFNLLDFIHPMGGDSTILDLQDFLVSNNILPLGSVLFVLFVTAKNGMQWEKFVAEVNTGAGLRLPVSLLWYFRYILPILVIVLLVAGYCDIFA
ncbi:MAG: sodium-dependent transporter [Oxalobacter sp.]